MELYLDQLVLFLAVKNLLLVGAGNIGSRYLESVIKEKIAYKIIVIDKSELSLNNAKKKWIKDGGSQSIHKIFWSKAIPKDISNYDLTIVSTSSKNRAELIKNISLKANVKNWIIEKILAQSTEELEIIKKFTLKATKVYVNTPKRQMKWFKKIQSQFPDVPVKIIKTGSLWGLTCNSIHYLDLVAFWTKEDLINLSTDFLDKKWFLSKREGFYEITGKLLAKFSKGTELILSSFPNKNDNSLKIKFKNKETCEIFEKKGIAIFSNGNEVKGKLELQSKIGGPIITKIITDGECDLPSFEESAKLHKVYLNSLLNHWNISNNKSDKLIPIT